MMKMDGGTCGGNSLQSNYHSGAYPKFPPKVQENHSNLATLLKQPPNSPPTFLNTMLHCSPYQAKYSQSSDPSELSAHHASKFNCQPEKAKAFLRNLMNPPNEKLLQNSFSSCAEFSGCPQTDPGFNLNMGNSSAFPIQQGQTFPPFTPAMLASFSKLFQRNLQELAAKGCNQSYQISDNHGFNNRQISFQDGNSFDRYKNYVN